MNIQFFKAPFLFGLLLFSLTSYAQNEHISDSYVILSSGEELKGTIEGEFDIETYSQVAFKTNAGVRTIYQPGEIQAFGLANGRFFKSEIIPIQDQPVFVQVLVSGPIDLYKWDNKYFINRGEDILELKVNQSTRTENGKQINTNSNQYIGVLTLAMNDECGVDLRSEIEKTNLTDRGLISLFTQYYTCTSIDYEVHATQVPFSKLSFRVQGGLGFIGLAENESNKDVDYTLNKTSSPYFEIGIRVGEFRNAPRLLVDLGLGYMIENNTVSVMGEFISYDLSGTEKYKSSSFLVPIHLSYILYKQKRSELYTGVGLTFWMTKFKPEIGDLVIDNGEPEPNVISSTFVDRKKNGVSPNLKFGYRNILSENTRLFVELKSDLLIRNMNFYPQTYHGIYNYWVGTLSLGIEI